MAASFVNNSVDANQFPGIDTFQPWLVCFTASLFFFYEFIQLNMFNAIDEGLRQSFALDAASLGMLGSASLLANVLFLFPAGLLLDRFSTRKLILLTLGLCVASTYGFAHVETFWWAWVCRFLAGVGSAFCFLSSIRLASRWFPAKHLALVTGLIVTVAMLGGLLAQTPLSLLVEHDGWRQAVTYDAYLGIVFLLVIFLFVRDNPPGQTPFLLEQCRSTMGIFSSLGYVLCRPQNILAGVYVCTMNMPIMILGAIWGNPYLQRVFHMSATEASMIVSMVFIGTIIGSPTMGWLSDLFLKRRLMMLGGAVIVLCLSLQIVRGDGQDFSTLALSFLFLGFFSSTQVLAYPIVAESNPLSLTATAVSIISFITQGGGALMQDFFGWLLVEHWTGQMQGGLPFYSVENFKQTALMLPLGFAIALLSALLIKEPLKKRELAL